MCELFDGEFFSTDDHHRIDKMNMCGCTLLQDENTVAKFLEHTIVVFSVENLQNRQYVLENLQSFKKFSRSYVRVELA